MGRAISRVKIRMPWLRVFIEREGALRSYDVSVMEDREKLRKEI